MRPPPWSWRMLVALLAFLTVGCVTVKVALFEEPGPLKEKVVSGYVRNKILLMDISGMILEGPGGSLWRLRTITTAGRVKEELEKAGKDKRIKALVLRINSPGGTVSGADVIYHEILAFKQENHLPVVACLQGLATSGGYYVAQAADAIVAYPTCITGSIGVIAMKLNVKGLMDKVGVESDLVKSGVWKDFWSPLRPATPREKQMMQEVIQHFYEGFVDAVAHGRNLSLKEVQKVADGKIYTGSQAVDLGLVDQVGYLDDALKLAKARAGLEEAKVVRYNRPGSYHPTVYSLLPDLQMAGPQFLYLWLAGEP
jgi:protease-4